MLDANVCKRGCKRLQPGMQVFASRKTTVNLHREMPSPDPILMCDEAHDRVIRRAILGSKERRKTSWRGFEGGEKAPNGWISCTKRALCAMIFSGWKKETAGWSVSFCSCMEVFGSNLIS